MCSSLSPAKSIVESPAPNRVTPSRATKAMLQARSVTCPEPGSLEIPSAIRDAPAITQATVDEDSLPDANRTQFLRPTQSTDILAPEGNPPYCSREPRRSRLVGACV